VIVSGPRWASPAATVYCISLVTRLSVKVKRPFSPAIISSVRWSLSPVATVMLAVSGMLAERRSSTCTESPLAISALPGVTSSMTVNVGGSMSPIGLRSLISVLPNRCGHPARQTRATSETSTAAAPSLLVKRQSIVRSKHRLSVRSCVSAISASTSAGLESSSAFCLSEPNSMEVDSASSTSG